MLDPTEAALLDQIALDPAGGARDVLADHWLGGAHPARGQLLRLRDPSPDLERLLADHAAAWTRPLRDAGFAEDLLELRRGFLEHPPSLPDPALLDEDLFRLSPAIYLERACIWDRHSLVYDARLVTPAGERGRFAIKTVDARPWQSFADREYDIARSIDHPNVVRVAGRAIRRDGIANVLRWAGRPLSELCVDHGRFDEACALSIGIQACDALEALHAAGIVHQYLHLGRLLVSDAGTVTLIGLAQARAEGQDPPQDPRPRRWMAPWFPLAEWSPERLDYSDHDHRTDLYSLAFVLAHLIRGRQPVPDENASVTRAIRAGNFELDRCSPPVAQVLRRGLGPVDHRHASAAELRDDLVRVAQRLGLELGPAAILATLPPSLLGS